MVDLDVRQQRLGEAELLTIEGEIDMTTRVKLSTKLNDLVTGGDPIVDPHFLNMLPYVATLVVLALVSRSVVRQRLGVPAALGVAYHREHR